jgi:hypothetical protein
MWAFIRHVGWSSRCKEGNVASQAASWGVAQRAGHRTAHQSPVQQITHELGDVARHSIAQHSQRSAAWRLLTPRLAGVTRHVVPAT